MLMVLVVDDESVIADTLAEILSRNGYATMTAYDADEALETALTTPPEMLITDVILPGMNGIELAIEIQRVSRIAGILMPGKAAAVDLLVNANWQRTSFPTCSPSRFIPRIWCEGHTKNLRANWCGCKLRVRVLALLRIGAVQPRLEAPCILGLVIRYKQSQLRYCEGWLPQPVKPNFVVISCH